MNTCITRMEEGCGPTSWRNLSIPSQRNDTERVRLRVLSRIDVLGVQQLEIRLKNFMTWIQNSVSLLFIVSILHISHWCAYIGYGVGIVGPRGNDRRTLEA